MKSAPCFVVIMAGGQGTRFWPRSRRNLPKQLLPIVGRRTMLQETVRRAGRLCSPARILVVAGAQHAALVRRQLPRLPAANILIEPVGRNTAPCIGLAAEVIAGRVPDATMVVMPADHAIADVGAFVATIRRAMAVARGEGCLVTLGIRPAHPETGYGYIEVGKRLGKGMRPRVFRARAFHEKPDRRRAARYLASGKFLWNSGIFVWRVSAIRAALARHLPEVAAALAPLRGLKGASLAAAVGRAYRRIPGVSIDYGVMERADGVAVVEADFGWNDVGSWAAMPAIWGRGKDGHSVRGQVISIGSTGAVVFSPDRLVALVGVDDLVVVDSEDALLICRRDRAQDVRRVVEEIERRRLGRFL